jgi:hypothetical protein
MTQRLHVKYNGEFLADIIMRMNALRQWDHQLRETKNYKETLDEGCFEGSQNPLDVHNAVRTRAYLPRLTKVEIYRQSWLCSVMTAYVPVG